MEAGREYSVVLLKPECWRCEGRDLKRQFESLAEEQIVASQEMNLDIDTAQELWANVQKYPWAQSYYKAMAGRVQVYILKGEESGLKVKREFREMNAELIKCLTEDCQDGFSPDLIHASDPGEQQREIEVLGLSTIAFMRI